jgi:hypothetical protein
MSGKYYKIQFDDGVTPIWLTADGTETGRACKVEVIGANELQTQVAGAVIDTVGGRVVQYVPYTRDKDIELRVHKLSADVWADLIALRETLLTNDDEIQITGTTDSGNPGDFDVQAKPRPDEMFSYERFTAGYVFGVVMRFFTTGEN